MLLGVCPRLEVPVMSFSTDFDRASLGFLGFWCNILGFGCLGVWACMRVPQVRGLIKRIRIYWGLYWKPLDL